MEKGSIQNFLQDKEILKRIDRMQNKTLLIQLTMLNWQEMPLYDLTGYTTQGNLSLDGKSSLRRTISASVVFPYIDNNIERGKENYLLSLNKKVKVKIGIINTLKEKTYPSEKIPVFWFPLGIYVITDKTISTNLEGISASLQLQDKMCLLNGYCGGTLPASVNFSQIETLNNEGQIVITQPTIVQIIRELVNHFGGEQLGKILINDIDEVIQKVMQWSGKDPLYAYVSYPNGGGVKYETVLPKDIPLQEVETLEEVMTSTTESVCKYVKYTFGDDIGYIIVDFYYPGEELVGNAGDTVCTILDKIRGLLGNFEYFYDVDGNFIFQEQKNYLNTTLAKTELEDMKAENYQIDLSRSKSEYDFVDSVLVNSYQNHPTLNQIRNDFLVWGVRETATGLKLPIRYHLAIDKKPQINTHTIMPYVDNEVKLKMYGGIKTLDSWAGLPEKGIKGIFYQVGAEFKVWDEQLVQYVPFDGKPMEVTPVDWRTELYCQGLESEAEGLEPNPYFVELKNEWPKIYDLEKQEWKSLNNADFYLDFIDSYADIGEYSIENIGRRSKVVNDNNINTIFEPQIPNMILIKAGAKDVNEQIKEAEDRGLNHSVVNATVFEYIGGGGRTNSAFNRVKELLFEHSALAESITISTIPIYYLQPNTRIKVSDAKNNINGDYIIQNISIPLSHEGMMSITASQASVKI